MQKNLGPNSLSLAQFIWVRIAARFILDCNSPTLNYVYLFNYLMLMILSNLFIAFNHLVGENFIWALIWQFGFYLFIQLLMKTLEELIAGLTSLI